jgi:hypothetical protein
MANDEFWMDDPPQVSKAAVSNGKNFSGQSKRGPEKEGIL